MRTLIATLALAGSVAACAGSAAAIDVRNCPPGDKGVVASVDGARWVAVCTDLV